MAKFKAGDGVRVLDDVYVIAEYAHQVMAGKSCKVISAAMKDSYDGYYVEHISTTGFVYTYFIRADHLIPDINPSLAQHKPYRVS